MQAQELFERLIESRQQTADLLVMSEALYNAISHEIGIVEARQGRRDPTALPLVMMN